MYWVQPGLPQLGMTSALQAVKYVEESLAIETSSLGVETLINVAKTSMSSKIVGSDSDYFAKMVVDAVQVGQLTRCVPCHGAWCSALQTRGDPTCLRYLLPPRLFCS